MKFSTSVIALCVNDTSMITAILTESYSPAVLPQSASVEDYAMNGSTRKPTTEIQLPSRNIAGAVQPRDEVAPLIFPLVRYFNILQ